MTQTQRPPTLIPSLIAPTIQTGISSSQKLSERIWRRFATLGGRFRTLSLTIIVVTCLTALSVAISTNQAASNLNTIGNQSIPGVSAAQSIIPYLEDIDAHAADYLTSTNSTLLPCVDSLSGQQMGQLSAHNCADKLIDLDQQKLSHYLFLAGQNATYPGSSTALEQTQAGLQSYIGYIILMRHDYAQATNPGNAADPFMQQAYKDATEAQTIMYRQFAGSSSEANLPRCTTVNQQFSSQSWPNAGIETNMLCLSTLGKANLDNASTNMKRFFGISLGIVFGLSIYSCIFLLWATWNMVTVTRKLFNPGLILALLVALFSTTIVLADFDGIYGPTGSFAMIANDHNYVYATSALEQEGARVQADEARWLAALNAHDLTSANLWQNDQKDTSAQFTSKLHDDLINPLQTSADAPLLTQAQQDWTMYSTQISQVTQKASTANNPTAIGDGEALYAGTTTLTFQNLMNDLQRFSKVKTSDYQSILTATNQILIGLSIWLVIAFPVLGVVGAWGISRRLKDF
ncbi:MAG TPA: hypothetical protein VGD98_11575 [Ktedonobacteraceae bacterium]